MRISHYKLTSTNSLFKALWAIWWLTRFLSVWLHVALPPPLPPPTSPHDRGSCRAPDSSSWLFLRAVSSSFYSAPFFLFECFLLAVPGIAEKLTEILLSASECRAGNGIPEHLFSVSCRAKVLGDPCFFPANALSVMAVRIQSYLTFYLIKKYIAFSAVNTLILN